MKALKSENFKGIFGNSNDEQGNAGVRSSGIRVLLNIDKS